MKEVSDPRLKGIRFTLSLTYSLVSTHMRLRENMIDHVLLTVSDFKRSVAFYAKALKPLGVTTLIDYEGKDGHQT
jgi:hypothetical protein